MISLLDELAAMPGPITNRCTLALLRDKDVALADEIDGALALGVIYIQLSRVLKPRGHVVSAATLSRHHKRECTCSV